MIRRMIKAIFGQRPPERAPTLSEVERAKAKAELAAASQRVDAIDQELRALERR